MVKFHNEDIVKNIIIVVNTSLQQVYFDKYISSLK